MLSIFGGTAAYHLNLGEFAEVAGTAEAETEFGAVAFTRLRAEGGEVLFLSRHGAGRLARSARFVNHRAHLAGAKALGAAGILSWNGVGAIDPALKVGQLVVPDDVLDETRSREMVIGGWGLGAGRPLVAAPFDEALRGALIDAAHSLQLPISTRATYVCTEGPRLETPAEIAAYGRLGAAVVGMTLCPEVWLAAEMRLPYASLGAVTNMAAGLGHLDPARDFGPGVGAKCLRVCLRAALTPCPPRRFAPGIFDPLPIRNSPAQERGS